MKYPRHGHVACQIQNKFIIVTGSRKTFDEADHRVELYDVGKDKWTDLPNLIFGRHYHSSCSFNDNYVYVFGGLNVATSKYLASIERLKFDPQNMEPRSQWEYVSISQ